MAAIGLLNTPVRASLAGMAVFASPAHAHARAVLRAFIYQRASHDPRKRGTSTRDQEIENRRTCEYNGWPVAGSFTDQGRSASRYAKRGRPEYDRMLEALRNHQADVIVSWESSRTNRDVMVDRQLVNLCADIGVLICYNGHVYDPRDPDDRYMLGQLALAAEREADVSRARVNRTVKLNTEGGKPRGRIPFGYQRTYDPNTGVLTDQVILEEEAALIRDLADRIYSGESLNNIAKDLSERGVPTATGKSSWSATQVKRLVLKPSNIGMRQHQGHVVGAATWKPILEPHVYETCTALIEARNRGGRRDGKVKFLLSGIATAACGGKLYVRPDRNRVRYMCTEDWCCSIKVEAFDAIVQAYLLAYIERPEFVESLTPVSEHPVARSAQAEIAELEARLAEATELAAAGALSMVRLSELEARLQPQIDAARVRARAHLVEVPPVLRRVAGVRAREVWEELDLVQKREVIRATLTVRLNKAQASGARKVTPDRYDIEPVRKAA